MRRAYRTDFRVDRFVTGIGKVVEEEVPDHDLPCACRLPCSLERTFEIDRYARKTYRANHRSEPEWFAEDIR
ncbi:MAG: hypothetical protein OXF02_04340 [Simkaniaceae bacterium]|nr:hypothetical protein [Simkaniaceae bacterium]